MHSLFCKSVFYVISSDDLAFIKIEKTRKHLSGVVIESTAFLDHRCLPSIIKRLASKHIFKFSYFKKIVCTYSLTVFIFLNIDFKNQYCSKVGITDCI